MIILCSPAKTMRLSNNMGISVPMYIEQAKGLVESLKQDDIEDIKNRFKVNDKLAKQIYNMYQEWDEKGTCCGLDSFNGLQFKQLDSMSLSDSQRKYAYDHLYILSGLYGLIKASDNISAYRLDVNDGFDIIGIYKDKIKEYLKDKVYLNLASKEYSALVDDEGIQVSFLVNKNGKLVNLATYSKMQRGKMLKYCITNEIDDINKIKEYREDGYLYKEELSNDNKLVFVKEE